MNALNTFYFELSTKSFVDDFEELTKKHINVICELITEENHFNIETRKTMQRVCEGQYSEEDAKDCQTTLYMLKLLLYAQLHGIVVPK